METTVDMMKYSRILWQKKVQIILITMAGAAVAIILGLLAQHRYEAEIVLYPSNSANPKPSLSSLGALVGFSLETETGSDPTILFKEVLRSRNFTEKLADRKFFSNEQNKEITLRELFDSDEQDSLILEYELSIWISDLFQVEKDKVTQVTRIKVLAPESRLASDLANEVVKELKIHFEETTNSVIKRNRISLEKNALEVKRELDVAVDNLAEFRARNKGITYQNVPNLFREFMDLSTEVEIHKEKYLLLRKELEMTRIEEIKEKPFIEILDAARIPPYKKYPLRKKMAVYGTLLGFLFGCLLVLGTAFYKENKDILQGFISEPDLHKEH